MRAALSLTVHADETQPVQAAFDAGTLYFARPALPAFWTPERAERDAQDLIDFVLLNRG